MGDRSFASMGYGERWRYRRKICQQNLQEEVKNHHTVILQKVHGMLDGLLKSPEKFDSHSKMYATSIVLQFSLPSDNHDAGYLSQFR